MKIKNKVNHALEINKTKERNYKSHAVCTCGNAAIKNCKLTNTLITSQVKTQSYHEKLFGSVN